MINFASLHSIGNVCSQAENGKEYKTAVDFQHLTHPSTHYVPWLSNISVHLSTFVLFWAEFEDMRVVANGGDESTKIGDGL